MTNYGQTPLDGSSSPLPLGCVYVPNVGLIPLQGHLVTTDGLSNTSALAAMAAMGIYNTTPPTLTNGVSSPLQLDSAGNLLVNLAVKAAVKAAIGDFVDGAIATLGLKADSAVIDPTAAGTVMAFLKGMQTELVDIEAQTSLTDQGTFNAVAPTLTNGQVASLQLDQYGNLNVNLQSLLAGQDINRNVTNVLQGPFQYTHITLAAPTNSAISNVPCFLHAINFTAAANGVIKIYDDIAANSGSLIRTITSPATLLKSQEQEFFDITTGIGLFIVTSGAAQDILVEWRP